jgi:hypothetical protein
MMEPRDDMPTDPTPTEQIPVVTPGGEPFDAYVDPESDARGAKRRRAVLVGAVALAVVLLGASFVVWEGSDSRPVTVGTAVGAASEEAASLARRSRDSTTSTTADTIVDTAADTADTTIEETPPVDGGSGALPGAAPSGTSGGSSISVPSGGGAWTPPAGGGGGGGTYVPPPTSPPPPPPTSTYSPPSVSWTITSCQWQPAGGTTGTMVINWTWNVTGGSGYVVVNSPNSPYYHPMDTSNPSQIGFSQPTSPVITRTDTGQPIMLGGTPYFSNSGYVPGSCAGWPGWT